MKPFITVLFALLLTLASRPVRADEGMWPFNMVPVKTWKDRHGFEPTAEWIKHIQKSCVRMGSGGSGSFVSPDGLIMTNHHVASDLIADLSTADHDFMRDGFYAKTRDRELKCPHLEVDVLMQIEDVTAQVNVGVDPDMTPEAAQATRKHNMAAIEKQYSGDGPLGKLHPELVTLYQGARYDLYLYKRYIDVRLVFAPEQQIAFFGGDSDNFEYPRFNLDCAFLRAYENDKPAQTPDHLKWSTTGAKENDLIFVAGHPARTQRLFTMDHLRFLRDVWYPLVLSTYNDREVALLSFANRDAEWLRIAKDDIYGVQNSRKAFDGIMAGMLDARLMAQKQKSEDELRAYVKADPNREEEYGSAWAELSEALNASRDYYKEYLYLEHRRTSFCRLFDIARKLVRAAEERRKPDGERMEEYRESNLASLEGDVMSTAPIHDAMERFKLERSLVRAGRFLGGDHPYVTAALGGMSPGDRSAALIAGTKLKEVSARRKLFDGGTSAIEESKDPMIDLARQLDPLARAIRKTHETQYESIERSAYSRIAQARFALYGDQVYPDATFTLRINDGMVKGFDGPDGRVPAMTTMAGLYTRAAQHKETPPFDLPPRWKKGKDKLNLDTPFNFISTNDIIGGNSGSPMFNKSGEVIGLVFDGNLDGLVWDFQFDMKRGRAVGVCSQAIIEALNKLYEAAPLTAELLGKSG